MQLRAATLADAPAIGAVHVAAWRESYGGILPEAMLAAQSAEARTAMWRSVFSDPATNGEMAVFVAEADDRAFAFGACGPQRDDALAAAGFSGEIGAIYVLRAHQQRGAGSALMATMAQSLGERGHAAASLWVLSDNAPARHFYERLGGCAVAEKTEVEAGVRLTEIAYGWRDLALLRA